MQDEDKSKEQLITELKALRERVVKSEQYKAEPNQAEKAVMQEKDFTQAVLDSLPGLFYFLNQQGQFLRWNREFERVSGYSAGEICRMSPLDFFNEPDKRIIAERIDKVFQTGEAFAEGQLVSKDQTKTPFYFTGKLFRFEEKPCLIGMGIDITERKRTEEALRESEARYRTVIENIQDIFYRTDQNGTLVMASPSAAATLGYDSLDEILGRDIASYWLYPDEREKMMCSLRKDGVVRDYEVVIKKKDGSPLIVSITSSFRKDDHGNILGVEGVIRDITDRKRAEEALRQSEERFSRFFRSTPVGTSITRLSDGQIVDANDAALRLVGYTREDVIGQNVLTLGWWANPGDRVKMVQTLEEQGKVKDFETQLVSKSGEIIDVLGSAEVIEMAEEKYMLSLAYDITERKRGEMERKKLEEQLFQAQKMESVGRLAGGVAHDFNNMLGVIIGRAELALQQDISNDKLQHNLKEILKAGLRSANLTRQLLAFARKQTAAPKILDLNDTISGMLKMLRRLIAEDINLSWQPGLDLWKIKIDPSQVDQILANLVVNARDAISGAGAITINTENVVIDDSIRAETAEFIPGQYVLLTVSDTGAGMSQEVRENIFEPFFTTKELGKGTGLGLSTVYGIVKQNDGFIYVASEPGKGTTFKIYLPQFEVETTQVPSEEITVKRLTGTETILLVEDDEAILNLSKMILENVGYTVLVAQTPGHAIHLAEEHQGDLDLLITDVVMPEMNGRELAEKLSAIRPYLRCLYMSGYTADLITRHGILDEGLNFIQKPFLSDDFAAKVRRVLDHLE
jgi:two-component system, cell cycle sensor histidine kinase and response regulator CckA